MKKFSLVLVPLILFLICATYIIAASVFAYVNDVSVKTEYVEVDESREVKIKVISTEEEKEVVVEEKEEVPENKVEQKKIEETKNISRIIDKKGQSNFSVPFYSQFSDISKPGWQKVSCGIASLAMLIDFYSDEDVSADDLLDKGISSGAYLNNAGWVHSGLIKLSNVYGLDGRSVSLAHLSSADAFVEFSKVVSEGPVMASVHYTFEPTNPIPHLVVITGVSVDKVFYNDPAEPAGGGSLSIDKFERAWKKRYIEIRPA